MIAKPFLLLTPQYRHLLTERFNILGEFDLFAYDNDFAMLNNHLTACKPPSFNVDDRILSDHQTVIWDSFKYYIKCRDEWDNEGSYTIYP